MNYTFRLLVLLGFVVALTSCQVLSRNKKKKGDSTAKKTEMTTTVPAEEKDETFTPGTSTTSKTMTRLEQNMLDEVNTLRTDPQGYMNHVKAYMADVRNNPSLPETFKQQELAAARELIAELSRMAPLTALKPHLGLYQVAIRHGQDLQGQSSLNHIGSDGSYPWDRVRKQTDLSDGNENLVGGGRTVRESVLILLVDSGVPGRGHRVNLLNPAWEYLACHHLNKVGTIDNCWVQLFGGKPKTTGQAVAGATDPPAKDIAEVTAENTIPQAYDAPIRDIMPVPVRNLTTTTPSNVTIPNTAASDISPPVTTSNGNGEDFSFMKQEEREMIREINLMRSNPRGYIPYVRQYLQNFKSGGWDAATVDEELFTGEELIKQLEQARPLSILKPDKALHQVALSHGMDLRQMGKIQHTGSDGSHPWERVRAGTSMTDGNENLVGGLNTARESVISLLIDAGIPDRGHRMTLMEPRWEYVACHKIGNIGEMPNCWIQVFGKQ